MLMSLLKAVKSWFLGGNMWVLWVGGSVALVVVGLWLRLDYVAGERDKALENYGAARSANAANTETIQQMTEANAILQRAVAENHARELAMTKTIATLKAQVENDQSKPTGCAPSLADPAPAAMLRALRGVRQP